MIFTKIWERYFLKEFIKVFFLFLGCFYGLYVIIDYASHTSALPHHNIQIKGLELVRYYAVVFISRAEILIPVALLIAFIKTLTSLNIQGELVGFLASGFKLKTLLRPFILVGLFCVVLMFMNEQFLLPSALKKLRHIEGSSKHRKHRPKEIIDARNLTLEDGSLFLFQSYDEEKEQFFDAYWVRSIDDVYRIKYLSPYGSVPKGFLVDHLIRQGNGELALKDSSPSLEFTELRFNSEILQSTLIDSDTLSFNELWAQLPTSSDNPGEKESQILTNFYRKLIIPWLCLLAILAPAPFCVTHSRNFPLFLIYVCGLFGMLAFYLFLDAGSVMAKRQVLPPFGILAVPFLGISGWFGWRFAKL
jgi:lipopolysaccharide export system permease protein